MIKSTKGAIPVQYLDNGKEEVKKDKKVQPKEEAPKEEAPKTEDKNND